MAGTAELIVRLMACTQMLLLALVVLRESKDKISYRYAGTLFVCIAGYLLAPLVVFNWHWGALALPVITLALIIPILFWYFAGAVFLDNFSPPAFAAALGIVTVVLGLLAFCRVLGQHECFFSTPDWLSPIVQITKLLWVMAAFVIILKHWRSDLVEARRSLRRGIVVLTGIYIVLVLTVELLVPTPVSATVELANTTAILIAATALSLHFYRVNTRNIFAQIEEIPSKSPEPASELAQQLLRRTAKERLYAGEGLTIETLAKQLDTQPHRLRQVINSELNYRNFNAFVNSYRIQEIADRLQQPEFCETPLLTLALDAGFRSLAPFNRCFKEQFGVTPSDYRKARQR